MNSSAILYKNIIEPFNENFLQPNSYDLTVNCYEVYIYEAELTTIDMTKCVLTNYKKVDCVGSIILQPGELYILRTVEFVTVPPGFYMTVTGRSSMARKGVTIHQCAGLIDSGYYGHITLEITSMFPFILNEGDRVAQVTLHKDDMWTGKIYNGQYQGGKLFGTQS